MLVRFINIWRSMLVVSSWIGLLIGVLCILSKTGIGFIVGLICVVFAIGGFFATRLIRTWLDEQLVVNVDKGVVTSTVLNRDTDGNEWTVIDGRLYVRDSNGNFIPFTAHKEA